MKITAKRCEYDLIGKKNHIWRAVPDENTPYEMLFEPAYWSLVAAQFVQFDEIRVIAEDGTYYAKLLVKSCDKVSAKMEELFVKKLDAPRTDQLDLGDYEVCWKGPVLKHCVRRKSDGVFVAQEIQFKAQAIAWVEENKKAA